MENLRQDATPKHGMESKCDKAAPSSTAHALLTYQHFPLAVGLGHLVSTAHLIQAHAPKDENNEAGAAAVLPRGLILVPVPIASAEETDRNNLCLYLQFPLLHPQWLVIH
jgi:low temperature requirement protein LtrA